MLRALIIFATTLFTVSSCTIGIHLQINPDNSGTYAFEIIYSDSIKALMVDMMAHEDKEEMKATIFDDETMAKIPESITVHDLKETDSSATLAFDFPSIEDLNALFLAMQDGPKMTQYMEHKGQKKYTFLFNTGKDKDGDDSSMEMFSEILFRIDLYFPEREIQKVQKIENYKITDNAQRLVYEMPLTELSKMKEAIEIQLKVKKQN